MRDDLYKVTSEKRGSRKLWFVQLRNGRTFYRTQRRALQIADDLIATDAELINKAPKKTK